MSSRRAVSVPANFAEKPPKNRGRCTNCLCISWKIFACILSHTMLIAIVSAYCWLGAMAFHELEASHEIEVRDVFVVYLSFTVYFAMFFTTNQHLKCLKSKIDF